MKRRLASPALLLCLAMLVAATATAQLPAETPSPNPSQTPAGPDINELPASLQLLATQLPDGTPVSNHLRLGGPALDALLASGDLALDWQLIPDDVSDHHFLYRLVLSNTSGQSLDPGDELMLQIGPGLGEYPVEGLGIAERLYSFVEPFAWQDGDLHRFPAGDNNAEWQPLDVDAAWAGLHSRYNALTMEPLSGAVIGMRYRSSSAELPGLPGRYLPALGVLLDASELAPDEQREWQFSIFAGPKTRDNLAATARASNYQALLFPSLWQWMRQLSFGLLWLLGAIHALVPSWGLAIILLAVLVRMLMYPVARRALQSQAAFAEVQKKIQPELQRIKREYKGGEQSEMILDLYKTHRVSPLAGLKPLLIVMIQIPVFVALFHVLGSAWELRDANFLWMDTLAEPDRLFAFGFDVPLLGAWFNLMPVLMALTTLATIKLSPAPAADAAASRRQTFFQVLMALGFLLLFYPFPAGMVLYWTMANVLHLLQQLAVERWRRHRSHAA